MIVRVKAQYQRSTLLGNVESNLRLVEGQAVFGFQWAHFAEKSHGVLDAVLTNDGMPVVDEISNKIMRLEVEYELDQYSENAKGVNCIPMDNFGY